MSNRRQRLLRKLATHNKSKEKRRLRDKQRLIDETEDKMVFTFDFVAGFNGFGEQLESALTMPYEPITKEDIDNLVAAVAAASLVPVEDLMPAGIIEGIKADQIFTDDPLKNELEDDK